MLAKLSARVTPTRILNKLTSPIASTNSLPTNKNFVTSVSAFKTIQKNDPIEDSITGLGPLKLYIPTKPAISTSSKKTYKEGYMQKNYVNGGSNALEMIDTSLNP